MITLSYARVPRRQTPNYANLHTFGSLLALGHYDMHYLRIELLIKLSLNRRSTNWSIWFICFFVSLVCAKRGRNHNGISIVKIAQWRHCQTQATESLRYYVGSGQKRTITPYMISSGVKGHHHTAQPIHTYDLNVELYAFKQQQIFNYTYAANRIWQCQWSLKCQTIPLIITFGACN